MADIGLPAEQREAQLRMPPARLAPRRRRANRAVGVSDMHYGNNVPMAAGHVYRVTVTLAG